MAELYSIVSIYHILFIHLLMHTSTFSTFWQLWIMLQWTWVYEYLSSCLQFFCSGIAGSYGNSIFSFLRNHQIVFHRGGNIWYSCQQYTRVPISPHPYQHLFFISTLLNYYHFNDVKYYLTSLWFWFALPLWLMILSIIYVLFAICLSSLRKCLFKSFAHF